MSSPSSVEPTQAFSILRVGSANVSNDIKTAMKKRINLNSFILKALDSY
jgi:hypothetical protein